MNPNPKPTRAFTLVELLVVIAMIAILTIMMLPAIGGLRESARRSQCINKVGQLILALQDHEMAHGVYPPGVRDSSGPIISQEQGLHQGWLIPLLPYLEEGNVYKAIDQQLSVYDKKNEPARSMRLAILTCPSSAATSNIGVSDYAGVHHDAEAPINVDQHGVLYLDSRLSHDDVTDGMRYTLFIGEKISEEEDDLGWMSGTRATLRNTGTPMNLTAPPEINSPPDDPVLVLRRQGLYVGGFGSWHPGGVVFAFGDGHVVFLVDGIDPTTYEMLASIYRLREHTD